ncbi:hypothetical protein QW180_22325 [Vibrio sinaloensis]|nr:hypothetical protein [Vibrio sinaloensis]
MACLSRSATYGVEKNGRYSRANQSSDGDFFTGLALVLFVFNLTAFHPIAAVATILVWGAFAFGNVPGLQVYVVKLAEQYTPDAVDVASGLNIAAFNVGIALGSWGGGMIVSQAGLMHTPWAGALIVIFSLDSDSLEWSIRQATTT